MKPNPRQSQTKTAVISKTKTKLNSKNPSAHRYQKLQFFDKLYTEFPNIARPGGPKHKAP